MVEWNGSASRFGLAVRWTREFVRLGAAVGLAAASAAAQLDPEFPLVTFEYPTNYALSGASIGDWDRDGFGDILLGHTTQLHWMRSRGDGSFDAPLAIPGAMGSYGVDWADFDGDGRLDVVDRSLINADLRIAYQTPSGSLGGPTLLASNAQLGRVKDFNGDGRLDLFVTVTTNGVRNVRLLLNQPTGWQSTAPVPIGNGSPATAGDFNADGLPDLAYCESKPGFLFGLVLRLGTTFGTFGPNISNLRVDYSSILEPADLDGDGREEGVLTKNSELLVVRVTSTGAVVSSTVPAAVAPFVPVADLDGDGDVDLLVNSRTTPQFLRNDGTGHFDFRRPIALDRYFARFASGDVNGDGAAEFVAAIGDRIGLTLSDGQGGWSHTVQTPIPRTHHTQAIGDVDGDGLADFGSRRPWTPDWQVSRGLGNGQAIGLSRIPLPQSIDALDFLDVDGDGDLDAFGRSTHYEVAICLNDGTGRFGPAVRTLGLGGQETSWGDFNGDGKLDLLETGLNLKLYLGTGHGSFGPPSQVASVYVPIAAIGDFDGDGRDDALATGIQTLNVWRGTASGSLTSPIVTPNPGSIPAVVVAGEFNGDGDLDVAWLEGLSPIRLVRAFGDGTGSFATPVVTLIGEPIHTLRLERVDLGPDTLDDLAFADFTDAPSGDHKIRMFASSPSGALTELVSVSSSGDSGRNFIADLTGDGVAEIVLLPKTILERGVTIWRR